MAQFETLILRVTNPDAQRAFYCNVLGMSDQGNGRVGFSPQEVSLKFVKADAAYQPDPSDLYWKIALSVPNLDLACEQLEKRGVSCTTPNQFRDIGYLAHFQDPEGFSIELIDHWFAGDRPEGALDESLLGGGAHLSLMTLRTADISAVEPDILSWGARPLSVQPVDPYGFTLYFYAFTDETPPNCDDLTAIENRTWVYRRPFTVLELQNVHAMQSERAPQKGAAGYAGVTIGSTAEIMRSERLKISSEDQ